MNKLKGFYLENRKMVILTASVIAGIFIIFAIIAVAVNRGRGNSADNTGSGRHEIVSDKESEGTPPADETTKYAEDETESAERQDETTAENQTEPPTEEPRNLPYMIKVNRAANCITVYENDGRGNFTNPVKAIVCSTGKSVGDTPLGTFNTLAKYNWCLMVDGTYGQYSYRIWRGILFHSVPYYSQSKSDLEWEQFNKLGSPASLGCVRICVADAIWLTENCPLGTIVEIYDDKDNPGPLGKPEMIKIPEDSPNRGWDPTDPDVNNPWHKCSPEIKTAYSSITVTEGISEKELLKKLKTEGYDTCGNRVDDRIKLSGVNLDKTGTYTVEMTLTDAIGKSAPKVTVRVTVEKKQPPTQPPTVQPPTQPQTQPPTVQPPTQPQTQPPTVQPPTVQPPTSKPSESIKPTEKDTEAETTTPTEADTPDNDNGHGEEGEMN